MRKKLRFVVGLAVAFLLVFMAGYIFGLSHQPEPAPTATTAPPPVPAEKPRLAHSQLYIDNHLGFQMEVPKEWVNRYAPIESGGSVGFAFETASSPSGTTKLDLAQVFTITRYASSQFSESTCGCKELGRSKTAVFGYKFDGQNVALATPLTVAGIQASMQNDISPYFQTLD